MKLQAQHFVIDTNLAQHAADLLRAYRQRLVAGEKPGREHIQPGAAQPNAGLDKLQFGRLVGQAEIGPGGDAEARHVKVGEIQRGEAKIVGVGVARVNGEPLVEGVVGPQRPGEIVDPGAAGVDIAVAKHRGAVVRQHLRIVQGAGDGDAAAHILTAGAERDILVAQAGVEAQVFGQLVFDVQIGVDRAVFERAAVIEIEVREHAAVAGQAAGHLAARIQPEQIVAPGLGPHIEQKLAEVIVYFLAGIEILHPGGDGERLIRPGELEVIEEIVDIALVGDQILGHQQTVAVQAGRVGNHGAIL